YEQKRPTLRSALLRDGGRGSGSGDRSRPPSRSALRRDFASPRAGGDVTVAAGMATLGADRATTVFGWDNEFDAHEVSVPAFEIDALPVTNAQFLEFINEGAYSRRELWSEEGW